LTQNELQNIIDQLEQDVSKDNATFGIFQYGGGSDESYIKADKEGLKLFAIYLLKAASNADYIISHKEKNIDTVPFQESWINEQSDTVIQYIEPVNKRPVNVEGKKYKERFVEKLLPYGCFLGLAILLIAIVIGLWTIVKWVF
jgi:hypothetical protein